MKTITEPEDRSRNNQESCIKNSGNKRKSISDDLPLSGTKPPGTIIINGLCNNMNSKQSERILENFNPESTFLYIDKCKAKIPKTKKLYVKLLKDKGFSPLLQVNSIKNSDTQDVVNLDSGYLSMYSQPKQLADILNKFAGSYI